jgi:CelD/BcsL family acetyltransferase involved in cellulose biosynthesis
MTASAPAGSDVHGSVHGPVHASWIATSAELARLDAEWGDLFQRANPENIFLSFGWMSTWWKHFGKGQLAVIAVRDSAGRLVAVAPFYIARSFTGLGARRLGFLADEHVGSDYLNVLADARFAAAAVEEIARILFAHHRLWDYIELRDTADSPLTAALTARLCAATFRCRPPSRTTWPVSARACGPITGAGAALSSANIKRNAWPFPAPPNWNGTSLP